MGRKPKAPVDRKPGGRPRSDAAKVAAGLVHLDAGDAEAAVCESGLSLATLYRAREKRDAGAVTSPPSPPPDPLASAEVQLPQGGAATTKPDQLLVLVRKILAARDPSALAELDAGLLVHARGDEGEMAAWLTRPLAAGVHRDPLDAAIAGLDAAVSHAERLSPLHTKTASVLGVVASLAARVEAIGKGRPKVATRDEVVERIDALRDTARERILVLAGEASAKLAADRAELMAFVGQEVAPRVAGEIGKRLDAMLGATP